LGDGAHSITFFIWIELIDEANIFIPPRGGGGFAVGVGGLEDTLPQPVAFALFISGEENMALNFSLAARILGSVAAVDVDEGCSPSGVSGSDIEHALKSTSGLKLRRINFFGAGGSGAGPSSGDL
jgi:hypothetical protein